MIARIIDESTIDYRGKFGPVIFISGCNFRCGFCHNPDLINKESEPLQIEGLKAKIKNGWYNGVCITGGEPTLDTEIFNLCRELKDLGLSVKLDTNGSNPNVLRKLIEQGLVDYVAMDIKSSPELYNEVCGVKVNLKNIEESIKILEASEIDFEFRTTFAPIKNKWIKDEEIKEMVEWVAGITKNGKWILQEFIARDKGEILSNDFSTEKLAEEFRKTPADVLERAKKIVGKCFECEIV